MCRAYAAVQTQFYLRYLLLSEPEDMPTAESTWLTVSWLSWRSRLRDELWLAFSSLEDIARLDVDKTNSQNSAAFSTVGFQMQI